MPLLLQRDDAHSGSDSPGNFTAILFGGYIPIFLNPPIAFLPPLQSSMPCSANLKNSVFRLSHQDAVLEIHDKVGATPCPKVALCEMCVVVK